MVLCWLHEFVSHLVRQARATRAADERVAGARSRYRGNVRSLGRPRRSEGEQELLLRHAEASSDGGAREMPDLAAPGIESVRGTSGCRKAAWRPNARESRRSGDRNGSGRAAQRSACSLTRRATVKRSGSGTQSRQIREKPAGQAAFCSPSVATFTALVPRRWRGAPLRPFGRASSRVSARRAFWPRPGCLSPRRA